VEYSAPVQLVFYNAITASNSAINLWRHHSVCCTSSAQCRAAAAVSNTLLVQSGSALFMPVSLDAVRNLKCTLHELCHAVLAMLLITERVVLSYNHARGALPQSLLVER
jgi:hypothetical protein